MRNKEWRLERLRWEDWESLLAHTAGFAQKQVSRRWGSGQNGLVLAGGHDARSVASEAIAEVLAGNGRLAVGWTRQRLEAELERQVNRELRRVSSRIETSVAVSEWTVLPADEEGDRQSIFEQMEGPIANGGEEAERRDEEAELEMKITELRLKDDPVACGLLQCLRVGVFKRREIAAKLGIEVEAVTAARKRLERKARGLRSRPGLL